MDKQLGQRRRLSHRALKILNNYNVNDNNRIFYANYILQIYESFPILNTVLFSCTLFDDECICNSFILHDYESRPYVGDIIMVTKIIINILANEQRLYICQEFKFLEKSAKFILNPKNLIKISSKPKQFISLGNEAINNRKNKDESEEKRKIIFESNNFFFPEKNNEKLINNNNENNKQEVFDKTNNNNFMNEINEKTNSNNNDKIEVKAINNINFLINKKNNSQKIMNLIQEIKNNEENEITISKNKNYNNPFKENHKFYYNATQDIKEENGNIINMKEINSNNSDNIAYKPIISTNKNNIIKIILKEKIEDSNKNKEILPNISGKNSDLNEKLIKNEFNLSTDSKY